MNDVLLKKVVASPKIRSLGLKEDSVADILRVYNNVAFEELLDNGTINLGNGLILDVVHLLDRVHILRGVAYPNTRKFKLKVTLDDNLYEQIESYYNRLQEDIL